MSAPFRSESPVAVARLESSGNRWLRLFLIVAVTGCFLLTLRDGHYWGGDFAHYINHARNIATGQPYAETGYVYNPHNPTIGPRAYPPVFPAFLSLGYRLFGLHLTAFKVQMILVFAASLWCTARLAATYVGETGAVLYVFVLGFCPYFWEMKDYILSEHLFVLMFYLAILVAERWYRGGIVYRSQRIHAILLGGLIYLACGTRTAGIVLLPAVVLCEFFHFRRLTQFGAYATATASGLIALEKILLPNSGGGYLEQLSRLDLHQFAVNVYLNGMPFLEMWNNGYLRSLGLAAGILLGIVGLAGFLTANRPQPTFLGTVLVIYSGLILVWPSAAGPRMIVPLLPGYLLYVLHGCDWERIPAAVRRYALLGLCVFSIATYGGRYSRADYGTIAGVETPCAVELFEFVRKHTGEDEVCMFFKPRVLCLFTGRKATAYPEDSSGCDVREYAASAGATWVIARRDVASDYGWEGISAAEAAISRTANLVEIWQNDGFRVFRTPPPAPYRERPEAMTRLSLDPRGSQIE